MFKLKVQVVETKILDYIKTKFDEGYIDQVQYDSIIEYVKDNTKDPFGAARLVKLLREQDAEEKIEQEAQKMIELVILMGVEEQLHKCNPESVRRCLAGWVEDWKNI